MLTAFEKEHVQRAFNRSCVAVDVEFDEVIGRLRKQGVRIDAHSEKIPSSHVGCMAIVLGLAFKSVRKGTLPVNVWRGFVAKELTDTKPEELLYADMFKSGDNLEKNLAAYMWHYRIKAIEAFLQSPIPPRGLRNTARTRHAICWRDP